MTTIPIGSLWRLIDSQSIALWEDNEANHSIIRWQDNPINFTVLSCNDYNECVMVLMSDGVIGYIRADHFAAHRVRKLI